MTRRITARPDKRAALPPLPATIPSILGPVPVTLVKDLKTTHGAAAFGIWTNHDRKVRIDADLDPACAWQTYWHEWVHIALWDAGIKLRGKKEEHVCDALATARVREMLDGR